MGGRAGTGPEGLSSKAARPYALLAPPIQHCVDSLGSGQASAYISGDRHCLGLAALGPIFENNLYLYSGAESRSHDQSHADPIASFP
jgi:hypothetical protein